MLCQSFGLWWFQTKTFPRCCKRASCVEAELKLRQDPSCHQAGLHIYMKHLECTVAKHLFEKTRAMEALSTQQCIEDSSFDKKLISMPKANRHFLCTMDSWQYYLPNRARTGFNPNGRGRSFQSQPAIGRRRYIGLSFYRNFLQLVVSSLSNCSFSLPSSIRTLVCVYIICLRSLWYCAWSLPANWHFCTPTRYPELFYYSFGRCRGALVVQPYLPYLASQVSKLTYLCQSNISQYIKPRYLKGFGRYGGSSLIRSIYFELTIFW